MARGRGRDATPILEACAAREVDVLFCIGVDPLRDLPDAALARRALQNVPHGSCWVARARFAGALRRCLPADGRVRRARGARDDLGGPRPAAAPSTSRARHRLQDWEIFTGLALAMGGDLGLETLDELHEEIGCLLAPHERGGAAAPAWPPPPSRSPTVSWQLFSYPLLVDEGRLSERADELKAALGEDAFVEIHPGGRAEPGLEDGDAGDRSHRRRRGRAAAARDADRRARVAVFVPFNQPGFEANTLLSGSFHAAAEHRGRRWPRPTPRPPGPTPGRE